MTDELKKQSKQNEVKKIETTALVDKKYFTIEQICQFLQCHRNTADVLCKQCKDVKVGECNRKYYNIKEIEQIRASQQAQKQLASFKKIVLKATKEDIKTLFYALLVKLQMEKQKKVEGETNKIKEFVYVFKDDKYYKIGKTNNIQNRLNAFKTANIDIEAVMTMQVENAIQFETCLHNYFHDKWVDGEWFDLSEEDLQELVLMGFNYGVSR